MNTRDRRSDWTVLIGIGLVVLGGWLLLGRFFGWLVAPVAVFVAMLARIGWPLVLIAIGIVLVLRARGGGWNPAGGRVFRSRSDRMVTGVLAGVSQWLGVNPMPVRVFYVFFTIFTGFWLGVVLYILGTILFPEEGYQTIIDGGTPASYYAPTPPPAPPVPGPVPPAPQPPAGSAATREAPTPPPVVTRVPAPEPAVAPPVPPATPAPVPAAPAAPPAAPQPDSGFEPPAASDTAQPSATPDEPAS